MNDFYGKSRSFFSDFGKGRKMVLSTSTDGKVSSRMMSVVRIEDKFYFQTDIELRKYDQIKNNKNVALCMDNIQIEGECEEIGHPLENDKFCEIFKECFKGSFDAYTSLKNERLFEVSPVFIERWVYEEGVPYIEKFDFIGSIYNFEKYNGK